MQEINKDILKDIYPKRNTSAKKYDFGLLLVIGGSEFYTGSPAFAGLAGFKAGVDMVHILAPQRAADVIASFSPNLATLRLEGKWLEGEEHLSTLTTRTTSAKAVSHGKAAVVIGGGLGRSENTQKTVLKYLEKIDVPAVIDADGIHALAKDPGVAKGKNFLVTPHEREFTVLTGREIKGLEGEERVKIVQEESQKLGVSILLKGKTDVTSIFNGDRVGVNKTGSSYMTVGGTGDTLAGITGAIMAREVDSFTAAGAAAYINGRAGELAGKKYGESMTASNILEEIPNVLPKLSS